jgi:hypothetical protein
MGIQRKIDEILSHYPEEVKKLYLINPMFNSCVQSMARGTSPHEVIGTFVLCHQQMSKQLEELITLLPGKKLNFEDIAKSSEYINSHFGKSQLPEIVKSLGINSDRLGFDKGDRSIHDQRADY